MNDSALISACIKGDPVAQKKLYNVYGPHIMGLCLRYVHIKEDAEEVFHDAMIKIYSQLNKYRGESSIKTWMCQIGIHVAIDFLRRKKHILLVEYNSQDFIEPAEIETDPADFVNEEKALQILHLLPPQLGLMINLFCIDGLSHAEIGKRLGISEEASRTRLKRAKKALSTAFQKEMKQNETKIIKTI